MARDIELRHLRYFVAVAEELNFSQAATRLSIAQPSLSLQIQQLEARLGTTLLVRHPQVALTAAGMTFLVSAKGVLRHMQQTILATERLGPGADAVLDIGMASSAALTILPTVFRRFASEHPQVELRIHEMHSAQQFDALRTGRIQVGISREVVAESPFVVHELLREPYRLVLPVGHRMSSNRIITLTDCAADPFVLFPRATAPMLYDHIHMICRDAGFAPRIEVEAREWHTIVALVAAGLGISIAPASVQRLRIHGAIIRPIPTSTPCATLFLCYSDESPSAALQAFNEFVRSEMSLANRKQV